MASRFATLLTRQGTGLARSTLARNYSTASAGSEFIAERTHIKEHAAKSAELWRKVSMYVCIPGSFVLGFYIYGIEAEHHNHIVHEYHEAGNQAPERTKYEYNTIRRKGFPWGDGSKSLFHNDMVNHTALP
ncbi:Cytochrome c oxidase subunit 6A [Thecaphora frezii]